MPGCWSRFEAPEDLFYREAEVMTGLLPLGRVVATPGALEMLVAAGEEPGQLLGRHRSGDWGELDEQDRRENERSLVHGWRILSSYPVGDSSKDKRVWIITEADRSATTILLPEEY